jgi:hypothetical protein
LFGNCFGYFLKNWAIFSKSSGHPAFDQRFQKSLKAAAATTTTTAATTTCDQGLLNLNQKY